MSPHNPRPHERDPGRIAFRHEVRAALATLPRGGRAPFRLPDNRAQRRSYFGAANGVALRVLGKGNYRMEQYTLGPQLHHVTITRDR